jgi:hypothetical protein
MKQCLAGVSDCFAHAPLLAAAVPGLDHVSESERERERERERECQSAFVCAHTNTHTSLTTDKGDECNLRLRALAEGLAS